jgi:hypothetical protein
VSPKNDKNKADVLFQPFRIEEGSSGRSSVFCVLLDIELMFL